MATDGFYDSDAADNELPATQADGGAQDNEQQPVEQELPPWPYGLQAGPAAQPQSSFDSQETLTLIFKDGRPPQQIHNYILTRNLLYAGDRQPAIPVDQLDLAATIKVNHDAGVDFQLPASSR